MRRGARGTSLVPGGAKEILQVCLLCTPNRLLLSHTPGGPGLPVFAPAVPSSAQPSLHQLLLILKVGLACLLQAPHSDP